MDEEYQSPRVSLENRQKLVKIALTLFGGLALVALGGVGVLYSARTNPGLLQKFGIKNESQIAQAEVEKLVKEVSEIMQLPEGEMPTVATVTELDKVKDQQFFKNAANGDKVLIFTNAKRAILYRPQENKIIEVGVVNLDQQNGITAGDSTENIEPVVSVTPSPQLTAKPTVRPTQGASPTLVP